MTNARSFLWIALAALAFLLWNAWQTDYVRTPAGQSVTAPALDPERPLDVPTALDTSAETPSVTAAPESDSIASAEPASNAAAPKGRPITVRTDVLELVIDTQGASFVRADLLRYPKEAGKPEPSVRLLDDSAEKFFGAQAGLVSQSDPAPDHRALFDTPQDHYSLAEGSSELVVPFTWTANGVTVTRRFHFRRGDYVIGSEIEVQNDRDAPWKGSAYQQLSRVSPIIDRKFSFTNPEQYSFVGAAWYSEEEKFEKLDFDEFIEEPLARTITGGWAAQQQHYFFAAMIPPADEAVAYSTAVSGTGNATKYLVRQQSAAFAVAPHARESRASRWYIGPKQQEKLDAIAPGLGLTIDYGKVTLFAKPLFWLLNQLHKLVGNWGFAIVLTTLLVKLLLYPLSEAQYRSMARMRKVQPRIEALKERYGEDRQKFNQAMMELYSKEKINPVGGCLPLLVQLPIFFALYWVLLESVELRQAPFIGWLTNLSANDPYFVLPILNAAVMWITQKMSPAPAGMDPIQQKVLQYMPLVFSVTMAFFPAGLVLYWTINGSLGLLQQWVITKRIEAGDKKAA